MFSMSTMVIFGNFQRRVSRLAGDVNVGREFDPATLITLFQTIVPIISSLIAMCKKTPPAPPPLPTELAAKGVQQSDWELFHNGHWAATEGYKEGAGTYKTKVVATTAKELAEKAGTKKKLQKPAALSALNTSRLEDPAEMALAYAESQSFSAAQAG